MNSTIGTRIVERAVAELTTVKPLIPMYIHLIASALLPIYTGAHASLSRPTSAAKPAKRKRTRTDDPDESSEDEEEEETNKMEGMSPMDAIWMPIAAGTTLAGLYFLIQWLGDPTLLNKAMNAYFALFGVFSTARFITDALDIGQSIIFPRRHALDGALYHVHGRKKQATPVAGNIDGKEAIHSPLPGFLARIPLSRSFQEFLWSDRAMPGNKWTLKLYVHRAIAVKARLGPHGITGFILSLAVTLYFNFVKKSWFLTNLVGFGFSYNAMQILSPTTFVTGSLILGSMFFYDIYFVFFTPIMITVATSLEVPIKLVFPRPARPDAPDARTSHAMLGLGDVVLPGMMIGLALRFDLFLFYLRRQMVVTRASKDGSGVLQEIVKPRYFSLAGRWTDLFWTHSWFGRPLFNSPKDDQSEAPFTFPKTYFRASIVGYVLGMLVTLGVMQVFEHGQPALLYLVPGVLGSLWLTALCRGELPLMLGFSEAEEEEVPEDGKPANSSATGRSSIFSDQKAQDREARMKRSMKKHLTVGESDEEEEADSSKKSKVKDVVGHKSNREVFSFSIEAPWNLKHPRSIRKNSTTQNEGLQDSAATEDAESDPIPVDQEEPIEGPVKKRSRLR